MARINIEDKLHAEKEFKRLVRMLGDEDKAIGLLYRFWREAQDLWGDECRLMPKADFLADGFLPILESGMAEERAEGIYAHGSEDLFSWYLQKCRASKRAAQARSGVPKSNPGVPKPEITEPPVHPLAPAPAPTKKKEQEEETFVSFGIDKKSLGACSKTWVDTLAHFKIYRALNPTEEITIARAIKKWGAEYVDLALYGARYEPKTESFDPKDYVSLTRIFEKDKAGNPRIEKFVNWGSRKKSNAKPETYETQSDEEDLPPPDPERVRELLASYGFGKKSS